FSRVQGAAFAITGISKKGEPDMVGLVLAGESNMPGLIMRTFLSRASFVRSAGQVEGIPIYTEATAREFAAARPGTAPPLLPTAVGPCFAQLPGIVIVGSNKDVIGDAIRRCKKKPPNPSLATNANFAETAGLRRRAGLYFFVNPVALTDQIETNLQKSAN